MPIPITIGEADYCEGNESALTTADNVAVTTTGVWLFLRQPLVKTQEQDCAADGSATTTDVSCEYKRHRGMVFGFRGKHGEFLRCRPAKPCSKQPVAQNEEQPGRITAAQDRLPARAWQMPSSPTRLT